MKKKDIITLFEKSLHLQFCATGELRNVSALRLDQSITLSKDGKEIQARYHSGSGTAFLVERFASESLADSSFQQLQAAIKRYARYRRIAAFCKTTIKWVFAPLTLIMLALAINMAATRGIGAPSTAAFPGKGIAPIPQNFGTSLAPSSPQPSLARPPAASPAQLAKAMVDGVKSGKYSIPFSKGTKGTFYVFSDPSCTHCQDLEPELDKLAKDYTIHIFPVTVIGGEFSTHRLVKLLCMKPNARAVLWKKIVSGSDIPSTECVDGTTAITANNQIFRHMRFAGTPMIINAEGEQTPDSIPNTADAINQWMSASAAART